jgi:geranylgeranyl diphosphate synthase type I
MLHFESIFASFLEDVMPTAMITSDEARPPPSSATGVENLSGTQPDLAFVATRVRPYLDRLLADEQERWKGLGAPWCDPVRTLGGFLSHGKALRPRFCFWGYAALAGDPGAEPLVAACAALELLHAFALIHDDLMDASAARRGRPAVHRDAAAGHARLGWAGPADRYGAAVAMLTGDLAFALACRLAAALPEKAQPAWNELISELTAGQFLDLAGAARTDRSAALASLIARLKSGRYTVAGPLRLGAAIAGKQVPAGLGRYGELVGEAFQLRDDLLGVFGDAAVTGKPVGEDLQAGKPTLLLAYASQRATGRQRALLDRAGAGDLDEAEISGLTALLEATGARARIEARITADVKEALAALAAHELPPGVAVPLRALARAAASRGT